MGGNYDFYVAQKKIEEDSIEQDFLDASKSLRKVKKQIQVNKEKADQRAAQGRRDFKKGKFDKLVRNGKIGQAQRTMGAKKIKHNQMKTTATFTYHQAKDKLHATRKFGIMVHPCNVPSQKIILALNDVMFKYPKANKYIIDKLTLQLKGPSRIALVGENGCGKSTLVQLILGKLAASTGTVRIGASTVGYLDQKGDNIQLDLNLIDNIKTEKILSFMIKGAFLPGIRAVQITISIFFKVSDKSSSCFCLKSSEVSFA